MTTATPPLGRRVVLVGVLVVAFVLLAVNTGVYVALRASLVGSLDDLLDERAQTVRIDARTAAPGDAGRSSSPGICRHAVCASWSGHRTGRSTAPNPPPRRSAAGSLRHLATRPSSPARSA